MRAPTPWNEAARLAEMCEFDFSDRTCCESLDNITRIAAGLSGSPVAMVSLVEAERQLFVSRFGTETTETHRDDAFCAHAILDPSAPLMIHDTMLDTRFSDNTLVTGAMGARFYAGFPMVTKRGHALGTLCVIDHTPKELLPNVVEALKGLAQMAMTALEVRRAMNGVRDMAMTDVLTGLPNRAAFLHAVDEAVESHKRQSAMFSLLYVDLDGFKHVNDTHGHAMGDEKLVSAASGLRSAVREVDMPARIGGDEFAALLRGLEPARLESVAERVRSSLEQALSGGDWPSTASVGAVSFMSPPGSGAQAIGVADAAMYEAKAMGGNRVVYRIALGTEAVTPSMA